MRLRLHDTQSDEECRDDDAERQIDQIEDLLNTHAISIDLLTCPPFTSEPREFCIDGPPTPFTQSGSTSPRRHVRPFATRFWRTHWKGAPKTIRRHHVSTLGYVRGITMNILFSKEEEDTHVKRHRPRLTLTYFDTRGSPRASACVSNTAAYLHDVRLTPTEFARMRDDREFPYGQVPVMTSGSTSSLSQGDPPPRGSPRLHPSAPLNAAIIDQWLEAHTEFMQPLVMSMYPERFGTCHDRTVFSGRGRDARHRQWCKETHLSRYMAYLVGLATSKVSPRLLTSSDLV